MSEVRIGQLVEGNPGRDAIHVAVAPVTAGQTLRPGAHVALSDGQALEGAGDPIGIVDPFLRDAVQPGQRFYLFLYPNTVTSLRHVWTHPAFSTAPPRSESRG